MRTPAWVDFVPHDRGSGGMAPKPKPKRRGRRPRRAIKAEE